MRSSDKWILGISLTSGLLVVLFQNFSAAPACKMPSQLRKNSSGQFLITQNTALCPGTSYDGGFLIETSHVTLDCQGATLRDSKREKMMGGVTIMNADHVTVRSCTIESFFGVGIKAVRSDKKIENADYRLEDPSSSAQPLDRIYLYGLVVKNNGRDKNDPLVLANPGKYSAGGGGALLRVKNSRIENSVFEGNFIGLYLEADSHSNQIIRNKFVNNFGREGLVLDAAHDNRVYGNVFRNNAWHGLSIYKNCGEDNSPWIRRHPAARNVIENNVFSGHTKSIHSVNSIRESAGMAVGLRQGLNLMKPFSGTDQDFLGCSDRATHMNGWLRVSEPTFLRALHEDYQIARSETDAGHEFYIGPHKDLVTDTIIKGNDFYGNTIALYVAADNTTVTKNKFYYYSPATKKYESLNTTDFYFGNRSRDRIGKPILNLSLSGNLYGPGSAGVKMKASSKEALAQIHGTEKAAFVAVTPLEAQSLLELGNTVLVNGKPSYTHFFVP